MRSPRFTPLVFALALVTAACSSAAAKPETTTTTVAATTSTTTTTAAPTTTTEAPTVAFDFEMPDGMEGPLKAFYLWLVDKDNEVPAIPVAMVTALEGPPREYPTGAGAVTSAGLESGDQVAVARVDRDVVVMVDDGAGWRIVGAALDGTTPWFGEEHHTVLILGSDARVGENQQKLRADSVHILTVVPEEGEGAIVGFPRDSWVQGPNGGTKLTNLMANRGPQIMLDTITELTQLDIDGYIVTGFQGFTTLMEELGGLYIDLPSTMRSGNNWANYPAGPQTLTPQLALRLARIRKGLPRGDFDRSYNQGLIMQAAMDMVQITGIDMLPDWVRVLDEATWTDLSTEDVANLGAAAFFFPSDALENMVLPGAIGTAGAASVVYLTDAADDVFRDLEDGLLTTTE